MYIASFSCPSPGIEPRIPTVSGSFAGLHTSIVAHSSRERSSECPPTRLPGAPAAVAEGAPIE